MIATAAAALAPDEAARRAGRDAGLFWLSVEGATWSARRRRGWCRGTAPRTSTALQQVWAEERASWDASGSGAATAGIPAGVGWLSYDLGWALAGLPPRAGGVGPSQGPTVDAWPLVEFHFHDAVWVRTAGGGEATIFAKDAASAARLASRLARPAPARPTALGPLVPDHPDAVFLDGVGRSWNTCAPATRTR